MDRTLFARDSWLWDLLFYVGLTVSIVAGVMGLSQDVQADYGINLITFHWIQLVSPVMAGIGGKNGMSWVKMTDTINAERKP